MLRRFQLLALVLSVLLLPVASHAQWHQDGVPIATNGGAKYYPLVVSDGAGGAIIAWTDGRNSVDNDVYAQRIDASGTPQWAVNGVLLCAAAGEQFAPTLIPDGSGGAIVTWADYRSGTNYDVYAQHIDALGTLQWGSNGVALCTAAGDQAYPELISDGAGGAIVTWRDLRNGNYDIYAQRINASGVAQWATNGVAVCTAAGNQIAAYPTYISDGSGGAIIPWIDYRSGTNYDIYAQRINASGVVQWTANGVALCTAVNDQQSPTLASDGAGGAIVTWYDERNSADWNIYGQRVNASGVPQWAADGITICTAPKNQSYPTCMSDGSGGAIVTWSDPRNGADDDVYAQRVDGTGTAQWLFNGVPVCTVTGGQEYPEIISDDSGGAIIVWHDLRNGADFDVYAQHVDGLGSMLWNANGMPLCTVAGNQYFPEMASDGAGNVIVTWYDYRSTNYLPTGIFAQRIESRYGYWGHPEPVLTAARDNPADQGGKVILNWTASDRDVTNQQIVQRYSIWRAMDTAAAAASGPSGLASAGYTVLDRPVLGKTPPSTRVVWHQKTATTDYYWELVGTQEAFYRTAYSFTAPTRQDSTSAGPATQYFQVAAEAYSPLYNWVSNVLSAHSVDNLAPGAPLYLMAARNGADVDLHWNAVTAPDLKDYTLYRATASGVTPIAGNFLANATDTAYVDAGAPTSVLYYIVTATDVHDNQGAASNEASVSGATGVGHTPALTALSVQPNVPNPFNVSTDLEIGLPAAAPVEITVYDVAGRRVRTMDIAGVAGWQAVHFSGRDARGRALASGVYFYRVNWDGVTLTRKMVIAR